jgi:sugar (pentulose or hexulose) kinase
MAPLRHAGAHLAAITADIVARTGLPANCSVICGVHDSNAALLGARSHGELAGEDATVLSTGTWFVAMRSPSPGALLDATLLNEQRDCLVNVDVHGEAVPSARFMGGREAELIGGIDASTSAAADDVRALFPRLHALIARGAAAYPSFVRNVGPFPRTPGRWRDEPSHPAEKRALVSLYLALMTDATLALIGSCDRLVIEGRFSHDVIFTRALAALRPQQRIFVLSAEHTIALGALRLLDRHRPLPSTLNRVEPLPIELSAYAERWRAQAQSAQSAA